MRVVVLGAGLAGLSAAWHLARAGHGVTVLEREDSVGGLARSWQAGPYTLDLGPHRFHSRDPELIRHIHEILDGEVVVRTRRSRIYLRGRYFDYPLRALNVLANMPPTVLARAVLDYVWSRCADRVRPIDESNFEGWVVKRFGRTLYREFFGTYTEKAWRMPCREISSDWAAQRISQADLWDAVKQTLWPPASGGPRGLAQEFWYPARGGIGELSRRYAQKLGALGGVLELGATVECIETARGRAERVIYATRGGRGSVEADHVLATIPLPVTLQALREGGASLLSPAEEAAAQGLRFLGIIFAYIEVSKPSVIPDHWVYLPSPELTVHRLSEFKNFCDTAAPPDSTVVCCEITCRPGDERWDLTDAQAGALAVADLERIGLIRPGQGRTLEVARLTHAYPVYDHAYRGQLELLKGATRRIENLTSTGRQGLHRYNNMDHSIAMGRKAARALGPGAEPAPALPVRVRVFEAPDGNGTDGAADQESFG